MESSCKKEYWVVDDFLTKEEVKKVIATSTTLNYRDLSNRTAIQGRRSGPINLSEKPTYDMVLSKLSVLPFYHTALKTTICYHRLSQEHLVGYDIETQAWHIDAPIKYAGVLYLNENPQPNTGTLLQVGGAIVTIENKFNRLVMYDATIRHRVENAFSNSDYPRLTMNVFIT